MTGKNLLVLGGTGWVARFVAEIAAAQGTAVTCLARGSKAAPAGVRFVQGDRTRPDAYDELLDQEWDEVVDVTWQPGQARTAVAALAARAAHWTYVSSGAVYLGATRPGETVAPLASDTATDPEYPAAKVACETAVLDALGDRAAIARVGLIGGPGDRSDRSGYWPGRLHLAGNGPVLVPDAEDQPVGFIDGRDFADWLAGVADANLHGIFGVRGEVWTFGEVLRSAVRATGFTGEQVVVPAERLLELGVEPGLGERALPLWIPEETARRMAPLLRTPNLAPGLVYRPLDEIMRDTLADEIERGVTRPRRAGLTRKAELEVLAQLGAPRRRRPGAATAGDRPGDTEI
jgi:2'-hydroxyisoflavone reductase